LYQLLKKNEIDEVPGGGAKSCQKVMQLEPDRSYNESGKGSSRKKALSSQLYP